MQTKAWHDKRIIRKESHVCDIVILFNSRLHRFPGKQRSRWTGPFEVTRVMPSGAVEIKSQLADPFMVNGQRLKHYTNDDTPTYYSCHDLIEPPFATQTACLHHCRATDTKQSIAWEATHNFIIIYLIYFCSFFFSLNNGDSFYSY